MSWISPALIPLREALATLYPDHSDARQVAKDVGLDTGRIDYDPKPITFWGNVLLEAATKGKLDAIRDLALSAYPDNPGLQDAIALTKVPPPMTVVRRLPRSSAAEGTLVDRTEAVGLIRSELEHLKAERAGRRLLLIGESGVGKTRIAEQGLRSADELGMVVLRAQCIDQQAEPLLPVRDCLSEYRGRPPADDVLPPGGPQPLGYEPFVASFLEAEDARSGSAPLGGSGGQGVYEGLAQVVMGLAQRVGVCLLVEDLTDADQDTLSFLEYLARKADASAVLIVATVKEDFLEGALKDRIYKWRAAPGSTRYDVPPLECKDVADLIAQLRNGEPAAADWSDEVCRLTGGNPSFIVQVERLAAENPRLAATLDVPDGIKAVLEWRLSRVTPDLRDFLEAAAVALEVTNSFDLIAHVAGIDDEAAADRLDDAVENHFLTDSQGMVGFTQNLLQRVLYHEIGQRNRRTKHVLAARWLQDRALFASASHHYERAGQADDMVCTALKGAEQAEHTGTYRTAVELYVKARAAGDATVIGVRLAAVYLILGEWGSADEVLRTLPEDLGEARVLRSDLHFVRGEYDRALQELRIAAQSPSVDSVKMLIRQADIHLYLGRLHETKMLAAQALSLATDQTTKAQCYAGIGTSLYHMGDIEGAERAYREGMDVLPKEVLNRDRFAYTVALHNLGLAREASGDWVGAERFHQEALQLRLAVSAAREVGHSRHSLIRCAIGRGSWDDARGMLKEARAAAVALGEELEQGKLDHTEARIELLTGGDPKAAVRLIEGARARFDRLSVAYDTAHASFSLAGAHALCGTERRSLEVAATARVLMERGGFGLLAALFPDLAYSYRDRVEGGLLGYAAGDAVGLPWERMAASEIDSRRLPSLHATREWPAGATSDDTALTLLVAEFLVTSGRPDGRGFLDRLAAAAPSLKGLGPSTTAAIEEFRHTNELPTGVGNTNGAVMRSLPVGWAIPIDKASLRRDLTAELSRATHPGPEAVVAACIGSACAAWALEGATPTLLLEIAREEAAVAVVMHGADPRIGDLLRGVAAGDWLPDPSVDDMDPYETVTRALWCVVREQTMSAAILAAVRLGGDTDTVAAIVAGLLGCRRSAETVRQELSWIDEVHLPSAELLGRVSRGLTNLRVGLPGG